jgi:hypothetical protein
VIFFEKPRGESPEGGKNESCSGKGGTQEYRIIDGWHQAFFRPELWDDGHILTEEEKAERKIVLDKWLSDQKLRLDSIFQPAIKNLTRKGNILTEAKEGDYLTLVMGRCGVSARVYALLDSMVSKIINRGAGIPVCVVE